MIIAHFDLVRLSDKNQWLQGIATLQARNTDGSSGRITLDHAMRVDEVSPQDKGTTTAASQAVEADDGSPATKHSRNRRREP